MILRDRGSKIPSSGYFYFSRRQTTDNPKLRLVVPKSLDEYNTISKVLFRQIRISSTRSHPCRAVGDNEYKRSMLARANIIMRTLSHSGKLLVLSVVFIEPSNRTLYIDSICSAIPGGGSSHMRILQDLLPIMNYKYIKLSAFPEVAGFYTRFGFTRNTRKANVMSNITVKNNKNASNNQVNMTYTHTRKNTNKSTIGGLRRSHRRNRTVRK